MSPTLSAVSLANSGSTQKKRLSLILAKCFQSYFANFLHHPVFIIGCGRSGTSLLARLLSKHPEIANWSEANEIWDPGWYPRSLSDDNSPPLAFDPMVFTARWWEENCKRTNEIRAIFGAYQWLDRKSYFLNKSPFNTFRIPYLMQFIPEAHFIHLVRDGRAVVYSYAHRLHRKNKLMEWPDTHKIRFSNSFDDLAVWLSSFWKMNIEEVMQRDKSHMLSKQDKLIEFKYEELCSNPFAVLKNIFDWMGLNYPSILLEREIRRIENRNDKWHRNIGENLQMDLIAAMEPIFSAKGYIL